MMNYVRKERKDDYVTILQRVVQEMSADRQRTVKQIQVKKYLKFKKK